MSKIEWCDQTINPIGGCSHISGGCKNCYAERLASTRLNHIDRYKGITSKGRWNGKTFFHKAELEKPYHWRKPQRTYICSMGDLFHESVTFDWFMYVMEMIESNPLHTFMMLTKRPKRMSNYINRYLKFPYVEHRKKHILTNLWLGVTAEDQEMANERTLILQSIPAAKHFLSIEPMLSKVNLHDIPEPDTGWLYDVLHGNVHYRNCLYRKGLRKVDWVICGAETGRNKRPMDIEWAYSLRDQCKEAGAPFFFKKDSRGLHPPDMPREFPKEIK